MIVVVLYVPDVTYFEMAADVGVYTAVALYIRLTLSAVFSALFRLKMDAQAKSCLVM